MVLERGVLDGPLTADEGVHSGSGDAACPLAVAGVGELAYTVWPMQRRGDCATLVVAARACRACQLHQGRAVCPPLCCARQEERPAPLRRPRQQGKGQEVPLCCMVQAGS